jgi:chromosome segregation ATPase
MIDKLYKLKQQQINQQLQLKQQAMAKIDNIDKELFQLDKSLHTATVDVMGAISDFRVLQIHKETMKDHMVKLHKTKEMLLKQIEQYDGVIIELNKESEQFNYILEENKKEELKRILKEEENVAAEYMQSKYIGRI